jgi:hypothetical protein
LNEAGHSGYCPGLSRASITEREAEKLDAAADRFVKSVRKRTGENSYDVMQTVAATESQIVVGGHTGF